jgi:uncharacterized protein (DUF1800 family)
MDRRAFLTRKKSQSALAKTSKESLRILGSGLNTYSGNWTRNEVSHLLKRTMFGATKADIDYFLGRTIDQAVDELLNSIPAVNPPLRDYGLIEDEFGVLFDDVSVTQGQTWVNDFNNTSDPTILSAINSLRGQSLRKWWAGLILNQNRSICEKMVLFWHHHFSVQKEEVDISTFLYRHHDLLRRNVLGNVRQLTKDVTIDPAMLIHLNGYLNSKLAPDENFARELQELMTVGKGIDSAYTEHDVIEAARVLTGWRIDLATMTSFLDAKSHDTGNKTFSAFYNNTTIAGSANGLQEIDQFINMIFSAPEAAKFICRKLYKWFVYYEIDDSTESDVITPLADILRNNNYEIKPVLEALFKSEHFFDPLNQACYIKSPLDLVVGSLREFGVVVPPYTDYTNGYPFFYAVYKKAAEMQLDLFQPPDVSGWPSYYQEPMQYELWINSNSLPKRADYTNGLIKDNVLDLKMVAGYSSNPADPNQLVDDTIAYLLRYPLSANSKAYIKNNFLINNSGDDTVWTNAWNSNNTSVIKNSLDKMFEFLMNLPEYHLC